MRSTPLLPKHAPGLETVGPGWITVPAWADLRWLRAAFSLRLPGASLAYGPGEQNLGWTREDDPAAVERNRRNFLDGLSPGVACSLVTLKQIHSGIVHDLTPYGEPSAGWSRTPVVAGQKTSTRDVPETLAGDGMLSAQPGQLLGILTADCVPVLIADRRTRVVGAFHAGWRGTLARIVETGVSMLCARHGSQREDLLAAIGPSIGPCCFEVGQEVQHSFAAEFSYAADLVSLPQTSEPERKPHLDLQEANRRQLRQSGLLPEHIYTVADCTCCGRDAVGRRKYFSYRGEGGVTGRMLSAIGTVEA